MNLNQKNEYPLVSVFCFVKNAAGTIRRCVESVLAQDYHNFEFIIQDGLSTDGTVEIIQSYHDPRIKLVSEPDSCAMDGYCKMLKRIKGRIIASCLSDEELLPHALSWGVEQLRQHPEAAAVYGDFYVTDIEGNIQKSVKAPDWDLEKYICSEITPPLVASFFRAGPYLDTAIMQDTKCGEYEIWFRLGMNYKILHKPGIVAKYAVHENELGKIADRRTILEGRKRVIETVCAEQSTPQHVKRIEQKAIDSLYPWLVDNCINDGRWGIAFTCLPQALRRGHNVKRLKHIANMFFQRAVEFENSGNVSEALQIVKVLAANGVSGPGLDQMLNRLEAFRSSEKSVSVKKINTDSNSNFDNSEKPKISFGIIVFNGEPFTRYCLRALYPFAHEIIVVEGACEKAASTATCDGHSKDGTLQSLHDFKKHEDPENKLKVITKTGFWKDKNEQSAAYADTATGNYLWQVDIDEFYKPQDMAAIIKMLDEDSEITAVSLETFTFWGDIKYKCDSTYLMSGGSEFFRLFKWKPGFSYTNHRPPTVIDQHGNEMAKINLVNAKQLASRGIYMYHYSLLFPKEVDEKISSYRNLPFEQCRLMPRWAMINYHRITDPFNLFNVHTYPGWLERFGGDHPPQVKAMVDDILSGNIRVKMRDNSDVESFIDDKEYKQAVALIKDQYQKRTQKEIRIDDPIFSHRIFKSIRSRYTPSVGIINTLCKRGGSAKVSSSIAHSLGQSGITVSEYIGQTTSGEPPDVKIITNQVLDNTIKDVCQQKGLLDYHIQSTFELIDNSELLSHDVLHLHNLHGGYFNPFALPLIADLKPSVWTLHDMQALTGHCAHSFSCDRWQRGCGNCPNLKIYPEISTDSTATLWQDRKIIYDCTDIDITVPSKWLKSKVQKSMLKNKNIHVIANGIDTRIFKQYDKTQIRRMFNLPQDKIIIGFAANGGMTNPWKGGNCLHQAFINLSSKHNNILLLNIGGEFFAREYPVLNLPYTNDKKVIAAAYSACDILAYPALAESFGLVPLEAQACGLPVVAFCTGAIPEVVYHNKTGLLVEPNNTRQFTLALEKLICDDGQRKTLSANAASSVSADNSIEAAGDAYINLYFELIERRKRTNPLNKNHLLKKMKLRQNCGFFARKLYQCGNIKGYEAMLKYSQKLAKSIAGAKHLPAVSKK